jgi:hypothetical protein
MRSSTFSASMTAALLVAALASPASAQTQDTTSRQAILEQAQAEKSAALSPYVPNTFERVTTRLENSFVNGTTKWHPFLVNAYRGGGFALGAGYLQHVSPYSSVDVRGSYSIRGYKLAEAEFVSPRLFHRRGELSIIGGWRNATQVAFYGVGTATSPSQRTNFAFEQPYAGARLTVRPVREGFTVRGGVDVTRWSLTGPGGTAPAIDTVFTPDTLPGLGRTTTYVHSSGSVGFDWRPAPGYARRGGYYGVTLHDYADNDSRFGFRQADYEATQHFPILRDTWVISLRGLATTTWDKSGQQVPFFMLPSLGGGSSLRGYSSWRFRDRNSLLMQAEWRIMVNRFFDTAVFYDTGKVAASANDLDFSGLKHDYGFGARIHTPFSTVLRIDIARSAEGTALVFASSPVF